MIASKRVIERNQKDCEFYAYVINYAYGKNSKVNYVCAEDYNSLIKLSEDMKKQKEVTKTVLLLFPDGNVGTKKVIDEKRQEEIQIINKTFWVRKGIFIFAEIFNIPVYNVLVDYTSENDNYIDILDFIESPREFKRNGGNMLSLFYGKLGERLQEENMYKWECWLYIHSWSQHPLPKVEEREYVSTENYDEFRFTLFYMDQKRYIFDSKYYLSYLIISDDISVPIKSIVLNNNIVL